MDHTNGSGRGGGRSPVGGEEKPRMPEPSEDGKSRKKKNQKKERERDIGGLREESKRLVFLAEGGGGILCRKTCEKKIRGYHLGGKEKATIGRVNDLGEEWRRRNTPTTTARKEKELALVGVWWGSSLLGGKGGGGGEGAIL